MIKSPCISLLTAARRAQVAENYPEADCFNVTPNFGKRSIRITAMRGDLTLGSMEFDNLIIPPHISPTPVLYPRVPFMYGVVMCTVNGTPAYYFGKALSPIDDRQMISIAELDGSDWNPTEIVDDITSCVILHAPIGELESMYQPEVQDADD